MCLSEIKLTISSIFFYYFVTKHLGLITGNILRDPFGTVITDNSIEKKWIIKFNEKKLRVYMKWSEVKGLNDSRNLTKNLRNLTPVHRNLTLTL